MRFILFVILLICSRSPLSAKVSQKQLSMAMEKGVGFLGKLQRAEGAISDTVNPLFNVWETILAATALYEISGDTDQAVLKKALHFLRSNENETGLICHNQKCKRAYCLESTSVYFSLLLSLGDTGFVKQRISQILDLQLQSGAWEIGNPDVWEQKQFPSVTAFVLGMLNETGSNWPLHEKACQWLCENQNQAGHWGSAWEYYGCPAYALWAAQRALKLSNCASVSGTKMRAISYIVSMQLADGSWHYTDSVQLRQTSPELQTAFMVLALQEAGMQQHHVVQNGISYLLKMQQSSGAWDGGFFPVPDKRYKKEEYTAATSLALLALAHQLKSPEK